LIEPHALVPVHWTVHASGPQSIEPHAPSPLQSIVHANPSGHVIDLPPADELILQVGVWPAANVHPDVHMDISQVSVVPPTQ